MFVFCTVQCPENELENLFHIHMKRTTRKQLRAVQEPIHYYFPIGAHGKHSIFHVVFKL